tara:strand:- start:27134 stop:29110 length:1977 start_codon:yes stop_codon:yes gene_type:complete
MSFTLQTLTEGIRDRHVGQQNKRLVEKWSRTGLLRGMDDVNRENMATLLENQAAQVLREANTMSQGDVGGFTNIAFPIVRRVFGGLIANELVSIQPMSLPSGLLFYLDYTYGSDNGPYASGSSIYGGPSGKAIQNGADGSGGQYDLAGSGFSRRYTTTKFAEGAEGNTNSTPVTDLVGLMSGSTDFELVGAPKDGVASFQDAEENNTILKVDQVEHLKLIQHDSQLIDRITSVAGGGLAERYACLGLKLSGLGTTIDKSMLSSISIDLVADDHAGTGPLTEAVSSEVQAGNSHNVRRLTRLGTFNNDAGTLDGVFREKPASEATHLLVVVKLKDGEDISSAAPDADGAANNSVDFIQISFVKEDGVSMVSTSGDGFGEVDGSPAFESDMAAGTPSPVIPEIDIKIESIPVTAQTRKLRARWSPELAQDLNAYHSMDAEVELTQILSEQIALEIDREILGDLLNGAQGANFFWSRSPGKFVNKRTGAEIARTSTLNPGPAFTGTVREWYETLTETIIDVANEIHRKTLRGSANFIVVSPDVATVLEASVLYRPSYSLDGDGQVGAPFTMGAEKIGSLSNRFTVYKDPYFPRNKILVGYKGGSYLETGFVYAPYVPLIVTPTIFQPEDFTPRKGVMTRYGKKMVRADFYGTVTCLDMNII